MAATAYIHTRVDPRVKKSAEHVLEGLGMTVSEAVRLFITNISANKEFPFELKGRAATQEAIDQLRSGKGVKRFKTVKDLMKDLNDEND